MGSGNRSKPVPRLAAAVLFGRPDPSEQTMAPPGEAVQDDRVGFSRIVPRHGGGVRQKLGRVGVGLGFRVGVPGMSVRVSTRGVRASVGPRIARVHVGSGRPAVSTGLGPFSAWTTIGGAGPRASGGGGQGSRTMSPAAQFERAARDAERAERQYQREAEHLTRELARAARESDRAAREEALAVRMEEHRAAIRRFESLVESTTTFHLTAFSAARRPLLAPPQMPDASVCRAEVEALYLSQVGRFQGCSRGEILQRAAQDADLWWREEHDRLGRDHADLQRQADAWWAALRSNDEVTVIEAVNSAYADNPAGGVAVGVADGVLSVVIRQPDLDLIPRVRPDWTPSGRPTSRRIPQRERNEWWLRTLGSNVLATVLEGLATAPGIRAVIVAALARVPRTHRVEVVALGRWERARIERAGIHKAGGGDPLRFLDLGDPALCRTSPSTSEIRAVDTSAEPALQALVDAVREEDFDSCQDSAGSADEPDPLAMRPFANWLRQRKAVAAPRAEPIAAPFGTPPDSVLSAGQVIDLPPGVERSPIVVRTSCRPPRGSEVDLSAILARDDRKVRGDADFVFYNQPAHPSGAAAIQATTFGQDGTIAAAVVRLDRLPADLTRVLLVLSVDGTTGPSRALSRVDVGGSSYELPISDSGGLPAVVVAEIYRRTVAGGMVWRLRCVGQGWADGLAGLARDHGVDVR
jgi:stress response protein SCP2